MLKRLTYYLSGLFIACFGVALIIYSDVGVGPIDILNLGLTERFGLTLGAWNIIVQAICLFLNAVILKKRPEYESVTTFLLWGIVLDFWMEFVFVNIDFALFPLFARWGCFLLGVMMIGMGIGIYLTSKLPHMPYDGTMVALSRKFRIPFQFSRTILEGSAALIGIFISGTGRIGIGTVIIFLGMGPTIQFFHHLAERIYHRKFGTKNFTKISALLKQWFRFIPR